MRFLLTSLSLPLQLQERIRREFSTTKEIKNKEEQVNKVILYMPTFNWNDGKKANESNSSNMNVVKAINLYLVDMY